jgi:hypothetical protein
MFTSITETEIDDQEPKSSPPWVWVGFLFAGAFFVIEILFVVLELDESGIDAVLTIILIGGWIYWLVCIHRIHKILNELTRDQYPYSPGEAALRHVIPMLLLALLLRFFDGAIGMAFLFGVTMYVSSKVKTHVLAVKRVRPDQLPPLPDPRIFSRPMETSTSPAQETAEGSRSG